ncbi:phospholipid carrier-dependent glycosyltransferase [Aeromicrobium sp.]|uniref:dolichyl-phosphate-mannose--protein mannosyltransferase n=1 Tax=Aeromicrobium sp. TaxID=1871063 RepID=UPI00199EF24F|nr:phospholipid carrier-dependent glycosyltransferase [Aeromicrobium sp.]MBC7632458.1 phospholipid carrier-dependent glycosyltransferase [Aeromicrobium sp.]
MPKIRWSERTWGWIGPIAVALLAFAVRVWNVGRPRILMFDETYYAKDSWSLLKHGYVQDFVEKANGNIEKGDLTGLFTGQPSWIVHPDGGKWVIALGEYVFGLDSFGWRISAVVVGTLTVLVLARLVRRMTGSTVIGCFAGLLLTFDGMHFVMSRLALLDVFLTFWLVCGVGCLVADRDWLHDRLDRYQFVRPWQLLAGFCFGMACSTKWSGVYVLAVFALLAVIWEVLARRRAPVEQAGPRHGWVRTTLVVGLPAFASIVLVAALVYLATWTGFLLHHDLYEARFGRGYGDYSAPWGAYVDKPTTGFLGETRDAFRSLWHFHVMTYDFHTKDLNSAKHPYQSNPLGWLVQERPVGVDAQFDKPAASCGAPETSSCIREVLILGNPILWWTGALALVAAVIAWIPSRDWRWGIAVLGVLASWLPWFRFDDRPIFSFYAVTMIPFTIIAISLVVNSVARSAVTPRQRYAVWLVAGGFLTAVIGTFCYFHPIYTDALIPYDTWHDKMWFKRWI